jgi:hypothetical protein
VVSLLAMLDFSAREYVELSYQLGLLLATFSDRKFDPSTAGKNITTLLREANRLNLAVTKEHINSMLLEMRNDESGNITLSPDRTSISITGQLEQARVCHNLESIYTAMRAELGQILLKAIPKEKNNFCDPKWLLDTKIFSRFPDTVDEFQKAGRCFAYGENTACVFHLMRVADFFLCKVAESLGAVYDAHTWSGIGNVINRKMQEKYQTKSDEWKQKETFYAEILTDLQALSRGHRNPVLHELEKKYDEREAFYMLTVLEGFARHVAENL